MKCKITRNAAKKINEIMAQEDSEGKFLRVVITHTHGTHAHYGLDLDTPGENDEIVHTDKEIDVLLDKTQDLLDGVKIDYLYLPEEGFVITNPSKGNHGDH
ncbi:HesB/IscA family protein [Aneurinibacillus aneurinilyticus]|jgi:iron-sulfur cluster assembly accessory protein|uniref:Iron-sulfur cluster assembly accessory protein n=2 Tax=Aneurinibacillus aneurinilyticus TaxID=1391 RepID=A0A848CTB3_ANEAE|nr:HesB-like protein [Aneurinibacillus aneurinilyticus]ERI05040.1 HesB-like protein [Aneurinibacillus aneurinilyticus ATCC 12856]MCI1693623.1 iron-sulfur cluster assembly accessory protein [Aneurinibacillus aneurinilyticus]MED0669138.1 iron-sulfur cluster assembly accessory protein [Aneurinibacillus aneurinilyticus]MED0708726.1 iron-sulfur cluster assembly accessory protein [Aneurinibacillus aneurinilyticus]MED0724313.1 iron-sulfur cluster assembly accessory protein [Aneurinibacillus aneurinil